MDRITIFGISGSGKSTFANELGKKLGRPIVSLDKIFWDSNWQRRYPTKVEFKQAVKKIVDEDKWIIEGSYKKTIDMRLERADVIVYFDFPVWRCLWRAFIRMFEKHESFKGPDGAKQKLGWDLIKYIVQFPKKEMLLLVENYKDTKKIFIVRNNREIKETLEKMC
ncbi:MAG: hypothetical protein NTW62_00690 [Candidatus Nomurabacteria bacterium]|nr:hypothetical protein [Candidatus Nomurabacteria bacterium]